MKTTIIFLFITFLFSLISYSQDGTIIYANGSDVFQYDQDTGTKKLILSGVDFVATNIKVFEDENIIYFTDNNINCIASCQLNGSNLDTVVSNAFRPTVFDVSIKDGLIVWTGYDSEDKIYRSNLDGSAKTAIANYSGSSEDINIAIDTVRKKIVWSKGSFGEIRSMNYDGSNLETTHWFVNPQLLQIDYVNNKLNWVQTTDLKVGIYSSDFDGSNINKVKEYNQDWGGPFQLNLADSLLYCRSTQGDISDLLSEKSTVVVEVNLQTSSVDTIHQYKWYQNAGDIQIIPDKNLLYLCASTSGYIKKIDLESNEIITIQEKDSHKAKETIVLRDSILFYNDGAINYYDFRTGIRKKIPHHNLTRMYDLTVDSLNNIYWYDTHKDSLMFYNIKTGIIKGLLNYSYQPYFNGDILWLSDNSLIFNSGQKRYYIDEDYLSDIFAFSDGVFAIDDKNNLIYYIDYLGNNKQIGCMDYLGFDKDFGYKEFFNNVIDMQISDQMLYIGRTTAEGGIDVVDLKSLEKQTILDSESISSFYIINNNFKELPGIGPEADFSAEISSDGFVTFQDSSLGVVTNWFWDFGDGSTSTDKNPFHMYNNEGKYTVSLVVSGPGGSDTITKVDYVNFISTNIYESKLDNDIQIYPNPSKGIFTIELPRTIKEFYSLDLYNVQGNKVFSINGVTKEKNKLDLSHLKNGIYFLFVKSDNTSKRIKIVISKSTTGNKL